MLWIKHTAGILLVGIFIVIGLSSCNDNSYPCPGSGQSAAADFNPFNKDGTPKGGKEKFKKNGTVKKKNPRKIRAK